MSKERQSTSETTPESNNSSDGWLAKAKRALPWAILGLVVLAAI